ncbi:MAG: alpha/beta hydrolase [Clostridia bacterium]
MTIDINGARIYYEVHGAGRPVLLLHGWGGKCESWLPVLRDFKASFRLVALDFPGHARSSDPPEPWGVQDYMEATACFMREMHIEGADVVAHSFGGRVAVMLAATHPELVGKLVLTGVPAIKGAATFAQKARGTLYKALRSLATGAPARAILGEERTKAAREALVQKFGSADYKVLSPAMRKTFSLIVAQDLAAYLPRISAPTVLFWGADDTAAPLWVGKGMEKAIPDAGLVVMEGAGHFAYLDRYADFRAVLENFLR